MKKILLFLVICCIVLVTPSQNGQPVLAQSNSGLFYQLNNPTIISGTQNSYYVYQQNGRLVFFDNGEFSSTSITDIKQIEYNQSNMFYLKNDTIFNEQNEIILECSDSTIGFLRVDGTFYHYTNNMITNGIANTNIFSNIQDVCYYNDFIYIINDGILYKINTELTTCTTLARLTWESNSTFKMKIQENKIFLLENTTLKLLDLDGTIINNALLSPSYIFDRTFVSGEVFKIGDFDVYQNQIIIADYITGAVQLFRMNTELKFDKLLVASFGADSDRLYNPSSLCYTSKGIAIADTGNNRIMLSSDNKLLDAKTPTKVTSDNNSKLYILESEKIIFLDLEQNSSVEISRPTDILDIQCNQLGQLYAITPSKILFFNQNSWQDLTPLDFVNSKAFKCDTSGQNLFIWHQNGIHCYNIDNNTFEQKYTNGNILDFALDYKNNLYILETNKISKIANNNVVDEIYLPLTYSKLNITPNSGDIYVIDSTLHKIERVASNDFVDNLNEYKNDISYFNSPLNKQKAVIAQITNECEAYKYPFDISPIVDLNTNQKIIILKEVCEDNSKFSYCLINNHSNKNILAYVKRSNLQILTNDTSPTFEKIRIITSIAHVHKFPTSLDYTFQTTTYEDITYDTVLDVISYSNNIQDSNGTTFFCVRLEDGSIGYISTRTAMNNQLDIYQKSFQPNGKLMKILQQDTIYGYNLNGDTYEKQDTITFEDKTLVFLSKALDTSNEYTKIVYINENNEQLSTYVLTKYVYLNDLTKHKYIGIALLFVAIVLGCIITALIVVLRKTKKIERKI